MVSKKLASLLWTTRHRTEIIRNVADDLGSFHAWSRRTSLTTGVDARLLLLRRNHPFLKPISESWITKLLKNWQCGRVSDLVDQLVHHQANGDEVL